ncbi:MAG: hypothetical protein JW940_00765 [Polyangiaceae bacterium]|nr:hypothetical protein [Polyangiaceae bacterium]
MLTIACGGEVGRLVPEGSGGSAGAAQAPMASSPSGGGGSGGEGHGSPSGGGGSGGDTVAQACPADMIVDMEDGTGVLCDHEGRAGVWYAFNDATGQQHPEPGPAGVPIEPQLLEAPRGTSRYAMHTSGVGFAQFGCGSNVTAWGAGIGFDLRFRNGIYGTYDASGYRGVAFWAKSPVATFIRVRLTTVATTTADYGGTCPEEPCNPHFILLALQLEWSRYEVLFADLIQLDDYYYPENPFLPDQLLNIQFLVPRDNEAGVHQDTPPVEIEGWSSCQPMEFDFWIDDVAFVR